MQLIRQVPRRSSPRRIYAKLCKYASDANYTRYKCQILTARAKRTTGMQIFLHRVPINYSREKLIEHGSLRNTKRKPGVTRVSCTRFGNKDVRFRPYISQLYEFILHAIFREAIARAFLHNCTRTRRALNLHEKMPRSARWLRNAFLTLQLIQRLSFVPTAGVAEAVAAAARSSRKYTRRDAR